MPQMAPMSWLMLFFIFIFILMMFNSVNYFSFIYMNNNKTLINKLTKKINWKW